MGLQVAIYCRVSTTDQSCERQEWELRAYAERAGFELAGIGKKVASGSKNQHPERQKLMALAQKRVIDAILVTELTRWGRSTFNLVQTRYDLQAWNVSLMWRKVDRIGLLQKSSVSVRTPSRASSGGIEQNE